jgi:hypothetical protein
VRKEFAKFGLGIRTPPGVSVNRGDRGDFVVDEEDDDRSLFVDLGDMDIWKRLGLGDRLRLFWGLGERSDFFGVFLSDLSLFADMIALFAV